METETIILNNLHTKFILINSIFPDITFDLFKICVFKSDIEFDNAVFSRHQARSDYRSFVNGCSTLFKIRNNVEPVNIVILELKDKIPLNFHTPIWYNVVYLNKNIENILNSINSINRIFKLKGII